MGQDSSAGVVRLARNREASCLTGHLWIFAGEIDGVKGTPAPGDLVEVRNAAGRLCGRGFFNPHSKIRVRLLTVRDQADQEISDEFWAGRVRGAVALRDRVVADTTAYRLVHAEGDLLPGLIVDRYGDLLVMQTLAYGMDRRKEFLAELLMAATGANRVYLRNDSKSRTLEGLPVMHGFLRGDGSTRVEIREGQARFLVDVERGQKTGWYCDQRENRLATAAIAHGASVLEVFCHTGAFGIHAVRQGAKSVLGLDSSAEALKAAREHADMNGITDRCAYREADAFNELRKLDRAGERFDLVILDPPAFARSKQALPHALAGYKDVNLQALRLTRPDGFLVTCSCSQQVSESQFWQTVLEAAQDARRQIRLIEARSQAKDHPVLAAMPETQYLKCLLIQVL
jgi:23S rRNA (cytosine1962-C5)-methyltransferase